MQPTLYGIRNCDTVGKARTWLDANGVAYAFHDYKVAGVEPAAPKGWVVVPVAARQAIAIP